jgi:hypothetical protein
MEVARKKSAHNQLKAEREKSLRQRAKSSMQIVEQKKENFKVDALERMLAELNHQEL